MGNLHAQEFAGMVEVGELRLEQAVAIHLKANHYPPVHEAFIPIAVEAINLANQGDWEAVQEYPNGIERTVAHTIEGLHLDAYVTYDED